MRDLEQFTRHYPAETGTWCLRRLHTTARSRPRSCHRRLSGDSAVADSCDVGREFTRGVVAHRYCRVSGDQCRVPVMEVMVNVPAVANLVREGKTHQINTVMQTSRGLGMTTFETATHDLINKGLIVEGRRRTSCAGAVPPNKCPQRQSHATSHAVSLSTNFKRPGRSIFDRRQLNRSTLLAFIHHVFFHVAY